MRSFHARARTNIRRLLWLQSKCDSTFCARLKMSCDKDGPYGKYGPCPYRMPHGWGCRFNLEERKLQPYQYRDGFHSTATFEKPYMHFEQYNRYRFKWASANVCHVGGAYAAGDLRNEDHCGIRCGRCWFGPYLPTARARALLGRSHRMVMTRPPLNAGYVALHIRGRLS